MKLFSVLLAASRNHDCDSSVKKQKKKNKRERNIKTTFCYVYFGG